LSKLCPKYCRSIFSRARCIGFWVAAGKVAGCVSDRTSADVLGEGVVSPLPEVMSLLEELRYVTKRMRSDEEKEDEINEWKFAAMVIDRLCFYLFSVYLALLTLVFFGFAFLRPIDVEYYSDENLWWTSDKASTYAIIIFLNNFVKNWPISLLFDEHPQKIWYHKGIRL